MNPRSISSFLSLLVILAAGPSALAGQSSDPDGIARLQPTARAVVERAVELMGGRHVLHRSGGMLLEAEGTMDKSAERQGLAADVRSAGPFREALAVSGDGASVAYDYREDRYDGTWEELREVYRDPDQHLIVITTGGFAIDLRSPENAEAKRRLMRRFPVLLLIELLERPASLRWLGEEDGRRRVSGALEDGTLLTLSFGTEPGLLREARYAVDYQSFGDAAVAWEYGAYEPVEGIGLVPHRYGVSLDGRAFTDMRVERVRTGEAAAAELIEVPAGIHVRDPQVVTAESDASSGARVDTLSAGVYRIANLRGGFHPLFLELGEGLVAMDAPAGYRLPNELPAGDVAPGPSGAWLSERYLDLMRAAVPDKPVSHVVVTHFHNDHGGGLRAFVADGATVVAPTADTAAIRALVDAPHTLAPDRLAEAPRSLLMEAVDDVRVLEGGGRRVEIIEVGENPHTRGMLVLHLPDEGVMFVSDLLDPTGDPERFPKASHAALDLWFGRWLDERGLAPEVIYTMHGSGRVTPAHLERLRIEEDHGPPIG